MFQQHSQSAANVPNEGSIRRRSTIPHAPRAMIQGPLPALDPLLERIQQDEVRRLYPRLAMFEALSGFKDRHQPRMQLPDTIGEARRDFLDSFSYLCDVEKGGKAVTAAALQQLPMSNFLWLAANEGIRDDILRYAQEMLVLAKRATPENMCAIQTSILELAVEHCNHRIQFYKTKVHEYAKRCRMELRRRDRIDIVKMLRTKLKRLSEPPNNLTVAAYIDLCYDMRSTEIDHVKGFSSNADDDFRKIAHFLWRLSATRSHVNRVVEAMITVPSLRRISTIRPVSAPEVLEKTIHRSCLSPYQVLHRIVAESTSQNPVQSQHAFSKLYQLDPPLTTPIFNKMASREHIVTRVHAELQIADMFSRSQDMKFVDSDKYIGCSKEACYFCYAWLSNHHDRYVPPATHYKIIPGCRGPGDRLNEKGAGVLIDMYSKISGQVGQDIFDFLQHNAQPVHQYMSTEAPSHAPSLVHP
ncbi:hypothetical protein BDV96DRAFT_603973 [Lophiotrema nucula]|uniref:Uncharacterized protein n=1 Tax=Lophiotrema nucula TaxID=690887 RepID=A0A6A5YTN5_9PLEO|nr:hypothetical protein BDV96DRAFT_603973 [Lophiotrema nucula]